MNQELTEVQACPRHVHLADALLDSAEGIVCLDREHRVHYYNRGAAELFGYDTDAVVGRSFEDLLTARSRRLFRLAMEELALSPHGRRTLGADGSLIGHRKDGERLEVRASISRSEGLCKCAYALVLHDVRAQRRQEARQRLLADVGTTLSESLRFDATIKAFSRVLVERFADFCLLAIEPADCCGVRVELAHRDPRREEMLAAGMGPDAARWLPDLLKDTARSGQPLVRGETGADPLAAVPAAAAVLRSAVGEDPSFIVVPLPAGGRSIGTVLFACEDRDAFDGEDVDLAIELGRRAAMALENDRLYETSTRTLQAHDEMLSFVSHDLRNPMNVIIMAAQVIRDRVPAGDEIALRRLEAIDRSVEQMDSLVRDLLTAARSSQGQRALHRRLAGADQILAEAAMGHRDAAQRKQVELHVRTVDSDLHLTVDLDMIVRALSNLIGNAVKFTPSGGSVVVAAEETGGGVRFVVTDTGPGIDEAHLNHVFERFWQAPGTERSGTGLGLAIVKGSVEAHGGTVRAESRVGHGSTFSFTIPVE